MDLLKKINKLIEVANKEDLDFIQDSIDSFSKYRESIVSMEVGIKIAKFKSNSRQEFVDEIQRLDRNRHYCHNSAIVSTKVLNRLCKLYDIDMIYEGSIENRQEVADFAEEVENIYYKIAKRK